MHTIHLLNGIRLHSIRALEGVLRGKQIDDPQKALHIATARLDALAELASGITTMRKPVSEESPGFRAYIERTRHVALPTDAQVSDFAAALDKKDDEKGYRREYFHGYHFFVDPSAGQEEFVYGGLKVTRISPKRGQGIKREEYLERFGYLEFEPIVKNGKILVPEAFVEDKRMTEDDTEFTGLYVPVPPEITCLAELVSYETPLDPETTARSNERRDAFEAQAQRMIEVVRKGREKYCK
jgi:hypothetical protein